MTVQIVSVTNKVPSQPYYCWGEFHKSIERHGFRPTILGMGAPWGGLMTKPRTLRRWLREGHCKADCLIVVDSWDLVFGVNPDVIAAQWEAIGRPWIAGAERNCFPDSSLADKHPKCATSFRFLNSGFIISSPADMLAVLEHMKLDDIRDDHVDDQGKDVNPNDQDFYMRAFLDQPVPMRLDSECQFVVNLCGVKLEEIVYLDDGKPMLLETKTSPCVFHWNGPAKDAGTMDPIMKHLGLR